MSTENRLHHRYSVEVAAEVTLNERVIAAATQNVSKGGVGLILDEELPEGTEVMLSLFFTQDGIEDPDDAPFEVGATVAWSAPSDDGTFIAGARFDALGPGQQLQLDRFLTARG